MFSLSIHADCQVSTFFVLSCLGCIMTIGARIKHSILFIVSQDLVTPGFPLPSSTKTSTFLFSMAYVLGSMGSVAVQFPVVHESPNIKWWPTEVDYGYPFQSNPHNSLLFYEIGIALLVDNESAPFRCYDPEWAIVVSAIGGLRGPYSYNHFFYTIKQGGMKGYELGLRVVEKRTALTYTSETSAESPVVARIYSLGLIQAIAIPRQETMEFIKSVPPFEPRDRLAKQESSSFCSFGEVNSRAWVLRVLECMSKGSITMSNGMQWAGCARLRRQLNLLGACYVVRSPVPITSFEFLQEMVLAHWRDKGRKVTIYNKPTIPLDFLADFCA
ncbi:hypothetical protein BJ165DRAFT_567238 [Panaeolus papilionaceus]|nr:hypothetical protein BJ165DRAFT_567238 [Panaeolus papilionaceus]